MCPYSAKTSLRLRFIQDTMAKDRDYVELGRACAGVCQALYLGLDGRQSDQLNQSVLDAIGGLTT